MDIVSFIVPIILARQPNDSERANRIAREITDVAQINPVFDGARQVDATAIALATIAEHESGFQERFEDCTGCIPGTPWCDAGRSVTMFALMRGSSWGGYSRANLCESNSLAATLATQVLKRFRREASTLVMMQGYASGSSWVKSNAARNMDSMLWRHLSKAGIVIRYRNGALEASTR